MPTDLAARIDDVIKQRHLLSHPFYQAWNMGTLPLGSLRQYAKQYYHFEAAYPTFLSGLHHRCADPQIRQLLLDNLWDEEHGAENHVELWLRFCDGLELDRDDVRTGTAGRATTELVSTYTQLTANGPLAAGAAALYAYESQVPEVAAAKIEGLRRFYGIEERRPLSFFEVHKTLDEAHSQAEREMVLTLADSREGEEAAVDAVGRATETLWGFLDEVY